MLKNCYVILTGISSISNRGQKHNFQKVKKYILDLTRYIFINYNKDITKYGLIYFYKPLQYYQVLKK